MNENGSATKNKFRFSLLIMRLEITVLSGIFFLNNVIAACLFLPLVHDKKNKMLTISEISINTFSKDLNFQ